MAMARELEGYMYRFFVEKGQIREDVARITGADVNHIGHVLRMRPGEVVLLSCGDDWEYTCTIDAISPDEVTCRVVDVQKPGRELPCRIYLFQCLAKGDKMETIVQKAVELGAAGVVPVASSRCVVKLDAKRAAQKAARWNAVAESAAKQSKRMVIPTVAPVCSFTEALEKARDMDVRLLPYERAVGMAGTRQVLNGIRPGQSVAVCIGPEGGFSESEVQAAAEAGFHTVTLGRRILRTETAGPALLSVLAYLLEQDDPAQADQNSSPVG